MSAVRPDQAAAGHSGAMEIKALRNAADMAVVLHCAIAHYAGAVAAANAFGVVDLSAMERQIRDLDVPALLTLPPKVLLELFTDLDFRISTLVKALDAAMRQREKPPN
ncbi:hypothetical protein [Roseicella aquatilis]|uniref:Uncharacterized protein n=1 Tax=Roseicella aquatilis TaxID=2527868 RepID=A0A4R4D1Q7_9PROT|nr:hypothetical protein [Roseicella aquatilis]TCZ50674.1 hypothetical protein EXY23_27265 [Roseicella aquatilis]